MKKVVCLILCAAFMFTGCKKKESEPIEPDKTITHEDTMPKEEEPKKPDLTGLAKSPLSGVYIDETAAKRRPVAVMINNLHKALPQSGIGQADILYEVLAEGDITRLVAVFQDFDAEKIGPVRSARDYYTYFALDNDAVFVHHGGSPTGYGAVKKRGIDNIDGMSAGDVFWRDAARMKQAGMYEHSSYTSAEKILAGCKERGYEMEMTSAPMFSFNADDKTPIGGADVSKITVPYSKYQTAEFAYDTQKKVYTRSQSGTPHIDELTGNPLEFKNVIIQYCAMRVVDEAGRRDVDLVGSGSGMYVSDGIGIDIKWNKSAYNSPTKWFDGNGNELLLNPGKTCVCVYQAGEDVIIE